MKQASSGRTGRRQAIQRDLYAISHEFARFLDLFRSCEIDTITSRDYLDVDYALKRASSALAMAYSRLAGAE